MREVANEWMKETGARLALVQQELMDQLPVDRKLLRRMERAMASEKLRRRVLIGAGVCAGAVAVHTVMKRVCFRCAVAREVSRQMEPVNQRLEALEDQNRVLREQNEALLKRTEPAEAD